MYTINDVRQLGPCYDPSRYLTEDWKGTPAELLRREDIPAQDRLWVVFRWLDARTLRLFTVWCGRQALALRKNPDPRALAACDVAELYANGQTTADALAVARAAARVATWAAASAEDAAEDAVGAAARVATWAAAEKADWGAAWAAARIRQVEHLLMMLESENEPVAYG